MYTSKLRELKNESSPHTRSSMVLRSMFAFWFSANICNSTASRCESFLTLPFAQFIPLGHKFNLPMAEHSLGLADNFCVSCNKIVYPNNQLFHTKGLAQVIIAANFKAFNKIFRLRFSRNKYDG
jgi:hypothetical protein